MDEQIRYTLDHSTATVDILLDGERLVVTTCGKGLADRTRVIDIPLSDLQLFCLVPTIGSQHLAAPGGAPDTSFDSEFIFSYRESERLKKKRLFVNSRDETLRSLVARLERSRPDASLLDLDPAEAQKKIGVVSASRTIFMLVLLLIGVPVLVSFIYVLYLALS